MIMNVLQAIRRKSYRNTFIVGLVFLYLALRATAYVNYLVDSRIGVQLYDPILAMLPPVADYSAYIFIGTYAIVGIMVLFGAFREPMLLIYYSYGLAFINIARCFTVWNIPIEPPPGIILLNDMFIKAVTPHGISTTKDLFFSGHAATTLFASLLITHHALRKTSLIAAFVVAMLILNQRVHYTIDILGGWLMAFLCYQIVQHVAPILLHKIYKLEAKQHTN